MAGEMGELLGRTRGVWLSDEAEELYRIAGECERDGEYELAASYVVAAARAEWGDDGEEPEDDDDLAA